MSDPLPLLGGAVEEMIHERASATPDRTAALPDSVLGAGPASAAPLAASLRELQEWFQTAITHPDGQEAGIVASPLLRDPADLTRLLTHGPQLHAYQRLGVYQAGYRTRLVECLADDYPVLQTALGHAAFEQLCRAYITAFPSTSRSLNYYGRHMAEFCRGAGVEVLARAPRTGACCGEEAATGEAPPAVFCADLAALEWALVEVLHAPEAPTLSHEQLSRVPPERWGEAILPPSQAARLLSFDYPVNRYFQAVREDENPAIPGPTPSATAVYRKGFTIWRMDLTPLTRGLLAALFSGVPLGEALGAIDPGEIDEAAMAELEQSVMRWFGEWVSGGLFGGVTIGGERVG
jgi:hypothetical protein